MVARHSRRSPPRTRSARSRGASGCSRPVCQRSNGLGGHATVCSTDVEPAYPFWPLVAAPETHIPPEHSIPLGAASQESIAVRLEQGRTGSGQGSTSPLFPVHTSPRTSRTGRTPHHKTNDVPPPPLLQSSQRREVAGNPRPGCPGVRLRGGGVSSWPFRWIMSSSPRGLPAPWRIGASSESCSISGKQMRCRNSTIPSSIAITLIETLLKIGPITVLQPEAD